MVVRTLLVADGTVGKAQALMDSSHPGNKGLAGTLLLAMNQGQGLCVTGMSLLIASLREIYITDGSVQASGLEQVLVLLEKAEGFVGQSQRQSSRPYIRQGYAVVNYLILDVVIA